MTDKQVNMIDSVFYYMWNVWSQEECSNVAWHHTASHFWDKWCGFSNKYGPKAAVAPFISELDDNNRRALYGRANSLYDGKSRRKLAIDDILDCDMYSIYIGHDNVKYINICGYFYLSAGPIEEDKPYTLNEFCGAEIPLDEFIKKHKRDIEKRESFLNNLNQYSNDFTKHEATSEFYQYFGGSLLGYGNHAPEPLLYSQITLDTPCGDYIDYTV